MESLKDLVAACRSADGTVIETPARTAPYTYDDFVPNVWKSGNLLGHYGVHPGAAVTVLSGPKEAGPDDQNRRADAADPIFAAIGATLVGATVELDATEPVESRALVLPAGWTARYELTPQCTQIAYGGPPEEPDVVHFEQEMWSENPIEPPERVASEDAAIVDESGAYSHGELLSAARDLVAEYDLDADSTIGLDAPLAEAGAFLPVLATLTAEATLELRAEGEETSEKPSLLVTEESTESEREVSVSDLTQRLRDTRRA